MKTTNEKKIPRLEVGQHVKIELGVKVTKIDSEYGVIYYNDEYGKEHSIGLSSVIR